MTHQPNESNASRSRDTADTAPSAAEFSHSQAQLAAECWRSLLGSDHVITDAVRLQAHGRNAIGSNNRASVLLRPQRASDVPEIVRIAAQFHASLFPISTGNNWGYGASSPAIDGAVILDLSALQAIKFVDRELGVVELEPGVTQGMLHQFLISQGNEWLTPVHGGGPDCSILGNALERGYGLTPTTDHFEALTSLEAVLADGTIYHSAFHALGAPLIGACHRWGIGPYVEGLFSQGNFGIVTKATFALRRRAEHTEVFFLRLRNESEFGEAVESIRDILSDMPAIIAGINLMNDRRMLSMSRPYPRDRVSEGQIMDDKLCRSLTEEAGISQWTLAGVIHCRRSMRRAVRQSLAQLLPASTRRPLHLNRRRRRFARNALRWTPVPAAGMIRQLESIDALLDLADGVPRRVALPLAYWLRGGQVDKDASLNPAQDGCGLIWYSPLVPMKRDIATDFVNMARRVCAAHGIEPLITLTSISARLFDSTVPILFRPEQPGATERAHACYDALVAEGREIGCLPYRLSHQSTAAALGDAAPGHFDIIDQLGRHFDPHQIISPGRYRASATDEG